VYPALGARLGSLRRTGGPQDAFDYLVPLAPQGFDLNRWQRAGCFVMLPFADRFANNTLAWPKANVRVAPAGAPAWLHGWGLRSAWHVEHAHERYCTLTYAFTAAPEWPWSWQARFTFELDACGITQTLVALNTSDEPMPLGLGFHPYFPIADGVHAVAEATAPWAPACTERQDGNLSVTLKGDALPTDTFTWFCETDGSARVRIDYPGTFRRVTLTSPQASHLVVHYRAGERYLCLEPCTHRAGQLDPKRDVAMPGVPVEFAMRLDLA
jgi:aldose 1-epimerase